MRAENKSEVGRAGKDKENSEDVRAFYHREGRRFWRRGDGISKQNLLIYPPLLPILFAPCKKNARKFKNAQSTFLLKIVI
jgi:hypothetical protein